MFTLDSSANAICERYEAKIQNLRCSFGDWSTLWGIAFAYMAAICPGAPTSCSHPEGRCYLSTAASGIGTGVSMGVWSPRRDADSGRKSSIRTSIETVAFSANYESSDGRRLQSGNVN
jgi:hypothetical protein